MKMLIHHYLVLLMSLFGAVGVFGLNFQLGARSDRHAHFEKFNGHCPDRNAPIVLEQSGIRTEGNNLYINFSIIVKRDVPGEPLLMIHVDRCKNKDNLDTCEKFHTFKSSKYCSTTSPDAPLWGPFYKEFKPRFVCPMKKGAYRSTNSVVDMSAFLLFPTEAYFWRLAGFLKDPQTEADILCLQLEVNLH